MRVKGDGCGSGTECGNLRQRVLGIYNGHNSIKVTVPGYDIFPEPGFADPNEIAIQNLPPMVLYGMNTLTGSLDGLDNLAVFSQCVHNLHFYKLNPIQEDYVYRLPLAECETLETSVNSDNEVFNNVQDMMASIEIVTHMIKDIMRKDVVIKAWFGTRLPNPALLIAVFMKTLSSGFDEQLEINSKHVRRRLKLVEFRYLEKRCLAQPDINKSVLSLSGEYSI